VRERGKVPRRHEMGRPSAGARSLERRRNVEAYVSQCQSLPTLGRCFVLCLTEDVVGLVSDR
jgi:hypothetical protein